MRRLGIVTALVMLVTAVAASVALATINPANGPNGTHFKSGTASCTVSGTTVNCTGYTLAGVGNINATAELDVTYSATVVCRNSGGQLSDSQHQGTFSSSTGPVPLHPDKNGNLTVGSLSQSAPSTADFLAQQSCPNPNWTPEVSGGIRLVSFTYTLTFAGFSSPYISITGP